MNRSKKISIGIFLIIITFGVLLVIPEPRISSSCSEPDESGTSVCTADCRNVNPIEKIQ